MQSYLETAMGLDVVDYTCRQDAPSCLTFSKNIQGVQSGGGPRKARQEWAKLMVEGNPRWQHPLIFQHVDAWGRPRGSMNLKTACLAPPSDPIREIATAYMGPTDSGYSILYWSSSTEVIIVSESAVSIRGTLLSNVNCAWRVDGPPLCSTASGRVVCICGEIPAKWDMVRWLLWIRSRSFGGIVYESGWTQWGDLTGPLSLPERKKIV